jgi:hypothetical protein
LWHVVQEVWYFRENAGIAFPEGTITSSNELTTIANNNPVTSFILKPLFVLT